MQSARVLNSVEQERVVAQLSQVNHGVHEGSEITVILYYFIRGTLIIINRRYSIPSLSFPLLLFSLPCSTLLFGIDQKTLLHVFVEHFLKYEIKKKEAEKVCRNFAKSENFAECGTFFSK